MADPPWFYNNRKTGGERKNKTKFGGGARKHYPLMTDQDLLAMADWVKSLTAKDCAFFMWATYPRLDFAVELLKAWGFRYATVAFTWVKTKQSDPTGPIYGPGYYTASNPEIVLLGVKGSMPPVRKMTPSVILSPRMKHSRKPDIHPFIDEMYPEGARLELFARRTYPGWEAWGNQIEEKNQIIC